MSSGGSSHDDPQGDLKFFGQGGRYGIAIGVAALDAMYLLTSFVAAIFLEGRHRERAIFASYALGFVATVFACLSPCADTRKVGESYCCQLIVPHLLFSSVVVTVCILHTLPDDKGGLPYPTGSWEETAILVAPSGVVGLIAVGCAIKFAYDVHVETKPNSREIYVWFLEQELEYNEKIDNWFKEKGIKTVNHMNLIKEKHMAGLKGCFEGKEIVWKAFKTALRTLQEDGYHQPAERQGVELFRSKLWLKYVFGSVLAYALLATWVWTIAQFIYYQQVHGCKAETALAEAQLSKAEREFILGEILDRGTTNSTEFSEDRLKELDKAWEEEYKRRAEEVLAPECEYLYGEWNVVHNVLFGLVTAVVVAQLTSADDQNDKTGLYARFAPILNELKKADVWMNARSTLSFALRSLGKMMVVSSTRVYTVVWILGGLTCLIFGSILGSERSGPLYTTGQTWLGVGITATYTYFGVNRSDAPVSTETETTTAADGKQTVKTTTVGADGNKKIEEYKIDQDGKKTERVQKKVKNDGTVVEMPEFLLEIEDIEEGKTEDETGAGRI